MAMHLWQSKIVQRLLRTWNRWFESRATLLFIKSELLRVSVIEPPWFILFVGNPPEPTRALRRVATHPDAHAARSAPRVLVPA